jgi:hypothetical protein
MEKVTRSLLILLINLILADIGLLAQNPLILDQFTADPSARVFEGKVFVYPSHDVPCGPGQGFIGFCMPDYHVFSSEDLVHWKDHGVILSQEKVPWVDSTAYSLWAPDCIFRDGKYYFYFPARPHDRSKGLGPAIGVAISGSPYGPYEPETDPIRGVSGIDPNPFIDKDGKAYLFWAMHRKLSGAKLTDDMKQLASEPKVIEGLPEGFKEGPYLFERNGIYYFTFPCVQEKTELLAYATGNNPMGPFEYRGVIMDESPAGCWTNHHSIIEYKGQWYLFYHHNDLSPEFDKNRSIRVDSLFFNEDGTIQKVMPTLRGVGISNARERIQPDRYSAISAEGVAIEFLDTTNRTSGWKTKLGGKDAWVRYNCIDFGNGHLRSLKVRTFSSDGGVVEFRLNSREGKLLARIDMGNTEGWSEEDQPLADTPAGIHDLYIISLDEGRKEIDWIQFE